MFQTGQRVVCINDDFEPWVFDLFKSLPKRDQIYTVRAIRPGRSNPSFTVDEDANLSISSADAVRQGVLHGDNQMMIVGDDGIIWRDRDGSFCLQTSEASNRLQSEFADGTAAAAFVATVLDGAENVAPGNEAAWTVSLTEAVYRSADEGRIIHVA